MSRSLWKGPFVNPTILKFISITRGKLLKITNKASVILPKFIGFSFNVYNGKSYTLLRVNKDMVGYKFGEFIRTRIRFVYKKKKKKKDKKWVKTSILRFFALNLQL